MMKLEFSHVILELSLIMKSLQVFQDSGLASTDISIHCAARRNQDYPFLIVHFGNRWSQMN